MKNILMLLTLSAFSVLQLPAQLSRVEPPNWWIGMKDPHLQLLIQGKDIAGSEINIDYPGIIVESVDSLDNPDFIFLNLLLAENIEAGHFTIEFVKKNKGFSIQYELLERKPASANREGFNNSDVIYLLMPDRFANGDPGNDVHQGMQEKKLLRSDPYGRHGGDLQGIIDHLDYIKEMGFTALWLNPVLENNQKKQSYHGYAITDFYKVDPRFGSNELYLELARETEKRGIKLIMDMVFNHCGSEHWWMKNMPAKDWINYLEKYRVTNHRRTVNQDPYAAKSDLELMRDGWFVPTMPDLNQRNPYMATYLEQNSIWWVEYLGLAGIRMDTYPYPDKYAMSAWCKRILMEYPNFNMVGEEWTTNPLTTSYWQNGQRNRDGYEPGLPSVMDFPLQDAVAKSLVEKESHTTGLSKMYEALSNDFIYPDPYNLVIFPDNHDMSRFFMQVKQDTGLYKLGITYFLTTRGIPQILYGSEILMTHTEGNDHGNIRKDFPGGWKGDIKNAFTGKNMTPGELEMQDFFRELLNWRKNKTVIHSGKLIHYAPENGIYVYGRYNDSERVMIILNKNKKSTKLNMDRFSELTGKNQKGIDVLSTREFALSGDLKIPARCALLLELE